MSENKKGYWIYNVIVVIIGMGLFAFFAYLIYDLVIKLSEKDFSNNTVIQALITLVITVFIGGYFSKWLELRNVKRLELYKTRTVISLKVIDLASEYYHHPKDEIIRVALICESSKVQLYFPDEVLKSLNVFIESEDKKATYMSLIDCLRKNIK